MKSRFFLFEGPDGAGKSTTALSLAEEASRQWKCKVVSFHGPAHKDLPPGKSMLDVQFEQAAAAVRHFHASPENHISILDRGWLSDIVYGNIFRDGPVFDCEIMGSFLRAAGCELVVFLPDVGNGYANACEKKEEYDAVAYGRIYEAYRQAAKASGAVVIDVYKDNIMKKLGLA